MENITKSLIFEDRFRALRYVLFWSFIMLDELLSFAGLTLPFETDLTFYVAIGLDIVIVLIINHVLLPWFFDKKRFAVFGICFIVLVAINMLIIFSLDIFFYKYVYSWQELYTTVFSSSITTTSIYGLALAIKLGKNAFTQREKNENLERERMKSELNYLKEQVNPHFLFNVLNSVYIQSLSDKDSVPDTVMKLSDLLRYQIYEASKKERVLLKKEIEFLKNYVDLEKLRRDRLEIDWLVEGKPEKVFVEPLIFLPLVENALKHSAGPDQGRSYVRIKWQIYPDNISMEIENSISEIRDQSEGGFGIKNLEKRLDLAYPKRHNLYTEHLDGKFMAKLTINLNEVHHH